MPTSHDLLTTIRNAQQGVSMSELLASHPDIARRTAQRWISQLTESGHITPMGKGPARRYVSWAMVDYTYEAHSPTQQPMQVQSPKAHYHAPPAFPDFIALSADSQDVLEYLQQPLGARHPVGYQQDFLDDYEPNKTEYLPEPLRRQLHKMGDTQQTDLPAGTYGRSILNRLLIDLSWASSHLEGNTYSRLDTLTLIQQGEQAHDKAVMETQMILNHKTAIELIVDNVETMGFDRFTLLNLHGALAENLLPDANDEGRVRQHIVEIGKSAYRPLSGAPHINTILDTVLSKAAHITDPFEQAFFIMVHIPYLQPFADVNKRSSRLIANLPLLKANLCPLTFLGVPAQAYNTAILGVYELTRVELLRDVFMWAYERSTQEYLTIKRGLAEPDPQRLRYRNVIKQTIKAVVIQPETDSLELIEQTLTAHVPPEERNNVKALIIAELRTLHEGVLARYGLRPSEFERWQAR